MEISRFSDRAVDGSKLLTGIDKSSLATVDLSCTVLVQGKIIGADRKINKKTATKTHI